MAKGSATVVDQEGHAITQCVSEAACALILWAFTQNKESPILLMLCCHTYALRFESGGRKAENGSGFPSRPWEDMSSRKVRLSPYKAPST